MGIVEGLALIVMVCALWFNALSYRLQANAADVSNYLAIHQKIIDHFRRLNEAEQTKKEREVTECMNVLEISCHLFNKKVIGKITQEMLEHFLENMLKGILVPKEIIWVRLGKRRDQSFFSEMEKFAKSHGMDFPPPNQQS